MKQSEPKNGLCSSTGSIPSNAAVQRCNIRLVAMGLLSTVIDLVGCEVLLAAGATVELAQIAAFIVAAIVFFALSVGGFVLPSARARKTTQSTLYGRWSLLSLLTLLLRSSVLLLLISKWHWQPQMTILIAVLTGDIVFFTGFFLFVFSYPERSVAAVTDWPLVTISIVTYTLIIKLIFMAYVNLIPEEAYYWNYAQHLDIGYLDHPPMVAWLIWLSTSLLDKSEFSVRFPAFLCWFIAMLFMVRLTLNLFDRSAAYRTALLLAVLPIYFGLGFFMTPDAPLFAAWAASLYFSERALVAQDRRAWWGLGVCLGLGMLSKYPIALLGGGISIFFIIDRTSRGWLLRREPYIAAITAVILFSPVLFWNVRNDWMSFAFQGTGRWTGSHHFALHVLFAWTLLLLTPTGLLGVVRLFWRDRTDGTAWHHRNETEKRQYLWAVTFTIVPLSVFVVYSFLNTPKLNWTAPVWLAAIPLLAADMAPSSVNGKGLWAKLSQRLWMPTIIALLLILTGSFYYIALGLPGAGPMSPERLFGEWRQLADKVAKIRTTVEATSGSKPIIVGMDKNFISSELSFYNSIDVDGPYNTGGAHLFGQRSLMWAFWFPKSAAVGKDLLLIDFDRKRLMASSLTRYFETLSDVSRESLENDGRVVGYFYWRVGHSYRE
jgi:dolichol-phosphate mannosyltransferase